MDNPYLCLKFVWRQLELAFFGAVTSVAALFDYTVDINIGAYKLYTWRLTMFEKHDKNLALAKKITRYMFIGLDIVVSLFLLIYGITLACNSYHSPIPLVIGVLIIIIGIPLVNAAYYFGWLMISLVFDNMYDVKLIRNKLYGADNAALGLNLGVPTAKEAIAGVDTFAEIKKIKELLDAGIITEEEFVEMKKKFL